jgi:hypothetical protein
MTLQVQAPTEWDWMSAAFCGAAFGGVAVVVHQVYVALFSDVLVVDPFIYVMTEMAVFIPGGAVVFAGAALLRNWLRQGRLGSS